MTSSAKKQLTNSQSSKSGIQSSSLKNLSDPKLKDKEGFQSKTLLNNLSKGNFNKSENDFGNNSELQQKKNLSIGKDSDLFKTKNPPKLQKSSSKAKEDGFNHMEEVYILMTELKF